MRRIVDMIVAVLLGVNMLTPIAGASVVAPHACCVRGVLHDAPAEAMSHDHCARGMQSPPRPSSSVSFRSTPQAPCHSCCSCLGPVVSSRPQARPGDSFLVPVPQDSHPFLHEFYPAEASSSETRQNPDRAPPSSASNQ
jgi:hypothetical protein